MITTSAVVLRNPDTGLQRRAKTNESGEYEFLAVPVGEKYSVQAEAKGFEKSVQSGIKLVLNQKYRADFKLVVGAVTETVVFFSSRRRHTRFDCDWSSDVCSSDLRRCGPRAGWPRPGGGWRAAAGPPAPPSWWAAGPCRCRRCARRTPRPGRAARRREIGRASCRERV